jgi:hypothetical protein
MYDHEHIVEVDATSLEIIKEIKIDMKDYGHQGSFLIYKARFGLTTDLATNEIYVFNQ